MNARRVGAASLLVIAALLIPTHTARAISEATREEAAGAENV